MDHTGDTLERLQLENAALREQAAGLRDQLLQAQRLTAIGTLTSSMTHEFNNILMTVINYAKMGLRHKQPAERERCFEKILAGGQRAARITTGMLSLVRGRGGRREVLSLRQLVEDVLVLVEKDLQNHRVRLETRFEGDPHAEVQPSQVQQVILNLVINARQAMQQGGVLTVGVRAAAELAMGEISIGDTGCGIPSDKLPHIFQAFYTTKTPDAQGQGGTGLGLSLCQQVLEAHHGGIRVESTVGQGTTFTLRFPLNVNAVSSSGNLTQRAG